MGKLEFQKEDSGKASETIDEIVKFMREKAKTVSEKEWEELKSELKNII